MSSQPVQQVTRHCSRCGQEGHYARACKNAINQTWIEQAQERNREAKKRSNRAYRATPHGNRIEREFQKTYRATPIGKEKRLARDLHRRYGMTIAQHVALFAAQGKKCAMPGCGRTAPGSKKGWATDHAKRTGIVRGILCIVHNTLLGKNGDDASGVITTTHNQLTYLARSGDVPTPAEAQRLIDFLRPYTKATVSLVERFRAHQKQAQP